MTSEKPVQQIKLDEWPKKSALSLFTPALIVQSTIKLTQDLSLKFDSSLITC